jgi:phosphoribosylformimino-5-aminoimidazole carboxamide ribotide isomerase
MRRDIAAVRVIGVIDLKAGRAVHAKRGRREAYQPVRSVLLPAGDGGNALALARAYRGLGLTEIYVADLDAIGGGELSPALSAICRVGVPAMVDAGATTIARAQGVLDAGATRVVVGLESLRSFTALHRIAQCAGPARVVFSLDLRHGAPVCIDPACRGLSPLEVSRRASDAGVASVLVLDVARVGAGTGPDLRLVGMLRRGLPAHELLVGGGVRNHTDLSMLANAGCDGALVATALHQGCALSPVLG